MPQLFCGTVRTSIPGMGRRNHGRRPARKYPAGQAYERIKHCHIRHVHCDCSAGNEKITAGDLCRALCRSDAVCILLYSVSGKYIGRDCNYGLRSGFCRSSCSPVSCGGIISICYFGLCQVFYENLTCNVSPFAVRQIWNGLMFKFGGKIL